MMTRLQVRELGVRLLIVSLSLWPAALLGQSDRPSLPVGTRVRVLDRDGGGAFTGNVLRLGSDTLAVAVSDGRVLLQLPTSRLSSLEVSEGRDRFGGAWKGAGVGLIAGGLLGAATLGRDGQADLGELAGFFAGGVLGGGFGAVIGAIVAPERWRRFPLSDLVR